MCPARPRSRERADRSRRPMELSVSSCLPSGARLRVVNAVAQALAEGIPIATGDPGFFRLRGTNRLIAARPRYSAACILRSFGGRVPVDRAVGGECYPVIALG